MIRSIREYNCSFCGKHKDEVAILVDGPGVLICDGCVQSYIELTHDPRKGEKTEPHTECSFCSFVNEMRPLMPRFMQPFLEPSAEKGRRLFRGSTYCICDDCLEICNEILVDQETSKNEP